MHSKSYDLLRQKSDDERWNKSASFSSLYKTSEENAKILTEKRNQSNVGAEEKRLLQKKFKAKIDVHDRSRRRTIDNSVPGKYTFTDTSTPNTSFKRNSSPCVKSILKHKEWPLDYSNIEESPARSKGKKRDKSVSFLIEDDIVGVKKGKSFNTSTIQDIESPKSKKASIKDVTDNDVNKSPKSNKKNRSNTLEFNTNETPKSKKMNKRNSIEMENNSPRLIPTPKYNKKNIIVSETDTKLSPKSKKTSNNSMEVDNQDLTQKSNNKNKKDLNKTNNNKNTKSKQIKVDEFEMDQIDPTTKSQNKMKHCLEHDSINKSPKIKTMKLDTTKEALAPNLDKKKNKHLDSTNEEVLITSKEHDKSKENSQISEDEHFNKENKNKKNKKARKNQSVDNDINAKSKSKTNFENRDNISNLNTTLDSNNDRKSKKNEQNKTPVTDKNVISEVSEQKKSTKKKNKSSTEIESEPLTKSRKKDVNSIANNLENLTIDENNPDKLTDLLTEMTVVDKKAKKAKKKEFNKNKARLAAKNPTTEEESDKVEPFEKMNGMEKLKKEIKKKWNKKSKKGDINDDGLLTSVLVENISTRIIMSYRKVLADYFNKYGIITKISVAEMYPTKDPKPVFATTVHFYSEDAATQALSENGSELPNGGRITVRRPLPVSQSTVMVRSYSKLTDELISNTFLGCGRIRSIRIIVKGKNATMSSAFVEFDSSEAVQQALLMSEDIKIGGKKIFVAKFEKRNDKAKKTNAGIHM